MSSRRAVPVPAFVAVVALVLSLMIVPGPAVAVATSVVCGPGTYASTDGQCTPASPGYFVATSGATAQKPCAAGTFAPTTGRTSCAPAPIGYAVPRVASSYAVQCVLGHYSYARGAQSCTARTGLEPRSVRVLRGRSSVTVAWRPPLPSSTLGDPHRVLRDGAFPAVEHVDRHGVLHREAQVHLHSDRSDGSEHRVRARRRSLPPGWVDARPRQDGPANLARSVGGRP